MKAKGLIVGMMVGAVTMFHVVSGSAQAEGKPVDKPHKNVARTATDRAQKARGTGNVTVTNKVLLNDPSAAKRPVPPGKAGQSM